MGIVKTEGVSIMLTVVSQSDFVSALKEVSMVTPKKANVDILTCVSLFFDTFHDEVVISGTNLDMYVKARIAMKIVYTGQEHHYCVNAEKLKAILDCFDDGYLHIEVSDKIVTISQGSTVFSMDIVTTDYLYRYDDFPLLPDIKKAEQAFVIYNIDKAFKDVLLFAQTNDDRIILNGVNFNVDRMRKICYLQATDTHRAIRKTISGVCMSMKYEQCCESFDSFTLYGKNIKKLKLRNEVEFLLQREDDEITSVFMRYDNIEVCIRTLEGIFPPFERILGAKHDTFMQFNKVELVNNLNRLKKYNGKDEKKVRFIIHLDKNEDYINMVSYDNKMNIKTQGEYQFYLFKRVYNEESGEYDFTNNVEHEQQSCINVDFLLDALSLCNAETVTLNYTGNNNTNVITINNGNNTMLIMPMETF